MSGGNIGDLALHFINRLNMMVVKVQSKFDLRRLCKVTGATPLARVVRFLLERNSLFIQLLGNSHGRGDGALRPCRNH